MKRQYILSKKAAKPIPLLRRLFITALRPDICYSDVGRSENLGGRVVIGGHNLQPPLSLGNLVETKLLCEQIKVETVELKDWH